MSMASNAVWAMQDTVEEIESRFGGAFSERIQKQLNECFKALEAMQEFNSTKKILNI
jgi:hypothetical protein